MEDSQKLDQRLLSKIRKGLVTVRREGKELCLNLSKHVAVRRDPQDYSSLTSLRRLEEGIFVEEVSSQGERLRTIKGKDPDNLIFCALRCCDTEHGTLQ
jgi:hypothetical protein